MLSMRQSFRFEKEFRFLPGFLMIKKTAHFTCSDEFSLFVEARNPRLEMSYEQINSDLSDKILSYF